MRIRPNEFIKNYIFKKIHSSAMLMLFLCAMYSGAPPIDLCRLKLRDFSRSFLEARIIRAKTKRFYIIRFPSFIAQALNLYVHDYKEFFINEYIFFPTYHNQSTNEHISPDSLRTLFNKIRRDLGLTDIYYTTKNNIKLYRVSLYTFRHFAAQQIYNNSGADIMKVKEYLNHKKITTTQKYLKGFINLEQQQALIDQSFDI